MPSPRDRHGWAQAVVFTAVVVMLTVGALLIPLTVVAAIALMVIH